MLRARLFELLVTQQLLKLLQIILPDNDHLERKDETNWIWIANNNKMVVLFGTNFSGAKRNEILLYKRWFETKQNFATEKTI